MSDQSYAESDVSMSPSQIFERLQVLRQLQLLQRGKLKKQQLQYQETTETSSSITEIVSHFSNSTSYNTFRSLLQSKYDTSDEGSPRANTSDLAPKVQEQDLIDGVSVLNISQESEFIVNSPNSARSQSSVQSRYINNQPQIECNSNAPLNKHTKLSTQNRISLDNMPILSPKKDFEALILEKLQSEKNTQKPESPKEGNIFELKNKKPFLRKGEGMSRFGLRKNDLVIQNTKSLPWRKRNFNNRIGKTKSMDNERNISEEYIKNKDIVIKIMEPNTVHLNTNMKKNESENKSVEKSPEQNYKEKANFISSNLSNCNMHHNNNPEEEIKLPKGKHPLLANKGKTWASILTKEQNDFLIQLKQSDYYKNFASPAKSIQSEVSYDENYARLCLEREKAEQNMFDLLERKVSDCNLENSFFERFMRSSNLECSGESTPLVMQKCLANNPKLFTILPDLNRQRTDSATTEQESCQSNCCSDTCSSVSTCCSCKTIKPVNNTNDSCIKDKLPKGVQKGQVNNTAEENYSYVNDNMKRVKKQQKRPVRKQNTDSEIQCHNDTLSEDNDMKANMADMNAKLVATSELLKDRLKELEDEINTFKKENSNLSKMREEIDLERHKFYEEKAAFEQKFNEDKILSEYYLAEEKDKLIKQKQMYEKYVREMRGRLNKKDRDEVANLKKDTEKLKEEIRLKDAKSTSIIARLRNQLKIMEKEKKDLQDEIDKLKKENRRIHHSNDITRRLTNIKYLEEINKKLNNMANKDSKSDITHDPDVKYKSYEIERQSRSRRIEPNVKIRPRAKSVPNLKVTSRYAKYFSQRDSVSNVERHKNVHVERLASKPYESDHDDEKLDDINSDDNDSIIDKTLSDNEIDNNLEKIYMETFRQTSPISNRSRNSNESVSQSKPVAGNSDSFFLQRNSSSSKGSIPPKNRSVSPMLNPTSSNSSSKSPISILSNRCLQQSPLMLLNAFENTANVANNSNRSKSPVSVSNSSHRHTTIIHNENYRDKLLTVSPEPNINKNVSKTNLNPMEISKPDGSRELRFPNGNIKYISSDGKYSKFIYYNGDVKENFYNEGRIKYFYAETKTFHTTHLDGLEVLEFPDGQVEKRYKDGSSEIRLPNGSIRYHDPKNVHIREEWRFPDGTALTISADGEQHIVFSNGQVEVHAKDHKRREFPDGTVKLVYNDGTSETRYASGRIRIKDKHGNLIMDSAPD